MFRVFISKGAIVVNHTSKSSRLGYNWHLSLRPFSVRSGRQSSFGLNSTSKGNDYENKLSDFYRDSKMQRLWDDTYERIAAFQNDRQANAIANQSPPSSPLAANNNKQTTYGLNEGSASTSQEGVGTTTNSLGAISANKQTRPNARHMFSIDEQQIMKLSFAEGYFYGQEGKRKSRYTMITFFRDVFILTVITGLIFTGVNVETAIKPGIWGAGSFEVAPEEIDARFSDVKGCDESKQELVDVVEFLRKPSKFTRLGGKLPKGVLLIGPPGTGKTLLARAVAGEAGVPFFQAVGSEFDEILVGQGARRVRELFNKAKQQAPCVIFIDEMDSIGGKRASTAFHPNANQTVNQLLSEMDGFKQNEGIIVIGATNRLNDLDRALLRPGRFDVQVTVPIPDYKGRRELFEFYLSKVRAAIDIDIDTLCRSTVGLTGADIKNIVNQAALKSATENADLITQDALEYARDKLLMGPERRSHVPDKEQNAMTAYHESGHTLVAYYTEKANKLHKVTIVSRGSSLGHTSVLPERDIYSQTKEQLSATLDVLLGGRVAEEIVYGSDRVTTGCSDDLRKANMIATQMVKDFGMSEKVGMRVVREEDSQSQIVVNNFSDATSELVESEISRLLEESKERVRKILTERRNELTLLAEALLKYETLDAAEVKLVVEGNDPKNSRQEKERDRRSKLSKVPFDRRPFDLLK